MAEPPIDNTNQDPNPEKTQPEGKPPVEQKTEGFDPSKLSDEDLNKVLEDQRLWKTDRLAKLREAEKKLKAKEAEDTKRVEEDMVKNKQFEDLANKHKSEAEQWQTKYKKSVIDNAILTEASKHTPQDIDAVLKLIDRDGITLDDDGKPNGITEAIDSLKNSKSYLFESNNNPATVGRPSNPKDPAVLELSLEQLSNPEIYNKYRDQISRGNYKLVK